MSRLPVLHQETLLSPAPSSPSQLLHIDTSNSQASPIFGAGRKRGFDEISGLDEESYARKHLATEGSVFFRRKERAPRSFLWRVFNDRKVLELRSVDLVHDLRTAKSESLLTFRVTLPAEIVRNGAAFGDPDDADALEVFALTASHELYTITLKRDLLTRETAPKDFDATTCVKKYTSNSLAFRHPYRLVAANSLELLISLHDGGIMRLHRQPNESGAQWRETFFSAGGWSGTLRGLIPLKRHQTVRYGNLELEPSAAAAIAKSPDGRHIWTVSLEHELKAWNVQTGKAVGHMDLLQETIEQDVRKGQKYIMSPEQGTLLQVITLPSAPNESSVAKVGEEGQYFLAIHSPKDHQFKFYEVKSTYSSIEGEGIRFEDLQPRSVLIPPIDELLNTSIWHLEEFHVQPGPNWQNTQLWIRARSGTLCRVFSLTFDLLDDNNESADVDVPWQSGWTVVGTGMQTVDALRTLPDFPGELENMDGAVSTPTERWLAYLFYPGRFSTPCVETALNIYRKGRGLPLSSGAKGLNAPEAPLQERLTQAIASKIILRRLPSEQPDYDRYQNDIQAQWKTFFSLLSHLHTRRHDSIGFAFDDENGLPWSVCADFVAPVRGTSKFDTLALNGYLFDEKSPRPVQEEVTNAVFPSDEAVFHSQLLLAAKHFSEGLSAEFRERFWSSVAMEATSYERTDLEHCRERVQALYDLHNFTNEVMDDDFQALETSAESLGGLGSLNEDVIVGLLEQMDEDTKAQGRDQRVSLQRFGDRLTVAVAQETLQRDRATLMDLLTLVVFMYGDLDQADLNEDFVGRVGEIYDALLMRVKHIEMLSWLARHEVAEPSKEHRSSRSSQTPDADPATVTLLERIFIGDWSARCPDDEPLTEALTIWSKQWTYGSDLWEAWDGVTGHIVAFLIKERCYELATDFQKFLSQSEDSASWLRYLEGRLLVATGQHPEASLKFKAAADGMAEFDRNILEDLDSAHLLSLEEKNHFGAGHSAYFQHVLTVFEKLQVFSYTADFAYLALEHLESGIDHAAVLEELDRRKAMTDSPSWSRVDDSLREIDILRTIDHQDEIRNQLFNALIQTSRFKAAFDALAGIKDPPTKKASLSVLIEKCCKSDAVPELLDFSFEQADLGHEADSILLALAKKSLSSTSSSGPPYHQILYAFRTQRADFRGAAEILHEYLDSLKGNQRMHEDPEDETLGQAYVLLINTLACCGEEEAWFLADGGEGKKRRLVTLADVRREYGVELDRRSDALHGRFPLVGGGDVMDVL